MKLRATEMEPDVRRGEGGEGTGSEVYMAAAAVTWL